MRHDITYCSHIKCPFRDCDRHPAVLQEGGLMESTAVSIADLSWTCKRDIEWLREDGGSDG